MKILIANRGEIARRVIGTARRLGHRTVAVYADPDLDSPFTQDADEAIRIGPAELAESYLSTEQILNAASAVNADSIHPGYGFLSENAAFARSVLDAGLIWIGPDPTVIDSMGSKIQARRIASKAGVPVIPGFDKSQEHSELRAAADRIGYPILIKAAAGGGGKGIRIALEPAEFDRALEEAATEAERSFGDGQVIVERFITRPRHVEVQVVGDKHGTVIELGTRECSVQRRYQKVLEEAPAPNLSDTTRRGLRSAAADLARSIGYDSTGTVEFVVDGESDEFFFLEMNTRLQVEHPVTEFVTGLDLVELQLAVAAGDPLPLSQADVTLSGHAFEARINAEDTTNNFAPQIGTISHVSVPDDVRWDSAIEPASVVTPYYDPMIAKLIVGGTTREVARRKLSEALDGLLVGGVTTNTGFHRWLINQELVVNGRVTTRFLDEAELPATQDVANAAKLAASVWNAAKINSGGDGPWSAGDRRFTPHKTSRIIALQDLNDQTHLVQQSQETPKALTATVSHVDLLNRSVVVNLAGQSYTFNVLARSKHWAPSEADSSGQSGVVVAAFPGLVAEVLVNPGDDVASGDALVVIEAMKMLHTLTADGPGTVAEVRVKAGNQVESNQILITFQEEN